MTTLDGTVDLARDRELVELCQHGDEAAFAELYTRYQRRLYRFCLRRLHAPDDAEEAVQEAFSRAWRAMPRFGGERRFYPWLSVIAANVCTDTLRRRGRVVPMDDLPVRAVDRGEADLDDALMRHVDVAMASEAFGHLSERHRRVLQLREATEWSAQRIAEHEGLAVPAVDTLLWRARQAFKREFAALSETGGLVALAGAGVAALRRALARAGARIASWSPAHVRGPGAVAAALALAGAAVAGGGVALVASGGHGPAHPADHAAAAVRPAGAPGTARAPAGARAGEGTTPAPAGRTSPSGAPGALLAPVSPVSPLGTLSGGTGQGTAGVAGVAAGAGGQGTALTGVSTILGGTTATVGGATTAVGGTVTAVGSSATTALGSATTALGSATTALGGTVTAVAGGTVTAVNGVATSLGSAVGTGAAGTALDSATTAG